MVKKISFFPNSRRAWIRIVEAFVAILLIAGVLLILLNAGYLERTDISEKVYEVQLSILREVELNSEARVEILTETEIPTENIPGQVQNIIDNRIPNYLECKSKICVTNSICALDEYLDIDIYSQSVIIAATSGTYTPRQLKLFCWVK